MTSNAETDQTFWAEAAPGQEAATTLLMRRTRAREAWRCGIDLGDSQALADMPPPDAPELARRAWELSAPLGEMLTWGGDTRVIVDPATGLNAYGCSPVPRPNAITFASTTATSISDHAFAAAGAARHRLLKAAIAGDSDAAAIADMGTVRTRLRQVLNLGDADIALCPSGTDGELYAVEIARDGRPLVNILVGPEETGSGVPKAAAFCHFAAVTAIGAAVQIGKKVDGLVEDITVPAIALRNAQGEPRALEEIDAEIIALVAEAHKNGAKILLHVVDASKTGLSAPSIGCVAALKQRYGDDLDVAIDACQMRLWPTTLRHYVDQGLMVLMTASKFITAPPFAAALIVPPHLGARIRRRALPSHGLGDYVGQGDWPLGWPQPLGIRRARPNIGLLLRWQAGLAEMDRLYAVPPDDARAILTQFMAAITEALRTRSTLRAVIQPPKPAIGDPVFDHLSTILTFEVLGPEGPLAVDDLRLLYRLLNTDLGPGVLSHACHIGQPVQMGATAGLRLSAGARLVYDCHQAPERLDREIAEAILILDKLDAIMSDWARWKS
jgi:hypothetical protein